MKKRLLSLLLVLCMVIGMLPVNALAADNEEPVTVEETAQTLPPEAEELPTEEETQPETETPETAEELTAGVDEVLAEEPLLEDGEPEPEPISISHLQAYCGTCKLYYSYNTDYCPRCGNPLMKP